MTAIILELRGRKPGVITGILHVLRKIGKRGKGEDARDVQPRVDTGDDSFYLVSINYRRNVG